MSNYIVDPATTKPKFELFEKVDLIFSGKIEGINVSVKKEFFIMGIRYCIHGFDKCRSGDWQAIGAFQYDLTESIDAMGNNTIVRWEKEIQKKVANNE